jgi:hypothetical protein
MATRVCAEGRNSDPGIINIRNVQSPHWRRWLGIPNRCVVPFTSFSENEHLPDGTRPPVWFALHETRTSRRSGACWRGPSARASSFPSLALRFSSAIAEAALRVRAVSFTLDGEAVVCGPDGVAVFDALHRRQLPKIFAVELKQVECLEDGIAGGSAMGACSNSPT